ncbi:hypothetical protein EYF80_059113 [Liparis tanakae]|uniref:Uncharacterized protein n=1 Tax=Liparis tanakae TaxID=230148 RepID=A0A4Z2EPM5_9TELE|nr:hypothetical protein EYF80_059113 [Liparis tanakae]
MVVFTASGGGGSSGFMVDALALLSPEMRVPRLLLLDWGARARSRSEDCPRIPMRPEKSREEPSGAERSREAVEQPRAPRAESSREEPRGAERSREEPRLHEAVEEHCVHV